VPVVRERVLARPDVLDDLKPGIVAVRMDRDEPPARREAARQRATMRFALKSSGARSR